MKILSAVFAAVLFPVVSNSAPLGVIYDDKIWTLEEINAYLDVTVYKDRDLPPGTIFSIGTPTWGVPARISMLDGDGAIKGYTITDGAKGRWVLVPVGDGTFKSLDFDATAPADEELTIIGVGGVPLSIPLGGGTFHGSGGSSLSIAAVPEPGTIGLLLGGAGVLALIARRRR